MALHIEGYIGYLTHQRTGRDIEVHPVLVVKQRLHQSLRMAHAVAHGRLLLHGTHDVS